MSEESTTADLVELTRELDLGHGVVFVALWEGGRPTANKASVREPRWHVYEWLQDKITRTTLYTDPDEARAAAERLAEERG